MYETGVLRACKRFSFLFAVVFLCEVKERAWTKVKADEEKKTYMRVQRVPYATYRVIWFTNRSIANRATPISITMEKPLMTRRDNHSFMLEFCKFTVSTLGVFYLLWQECNPQKSQTLKILF